MARPIKYLYKQYVYKNNTIIRLLLWYYYYDLKSLTCCVSADSAAAVITIIEVVSSEVSGIWHHSQRNAFIFKSKAIVCIDCTENQDWAKWARWAKIFKIIQSDNQLCSLICFLVLACLNQNINLSILFKIREKEQAKWAKWARILKNAGTDEQLCSLTCFFNCLLKQVWKYLVIYHIRNQKE